MVVIIAEKPSVGRDLARVVGAKNRHDGYMEGNGYAVTWAFGHLVQITTPDQDVKWLSENLPILPQQFFLQPGTTKGPDGKPVPDEGYVKQLGVIKQLFDNADYIVNAGDAGREGELIQRYIYAYVGCTKPVKRLWISSLTDNAIKKGLEQLHENSEFDTLYAAGKARSEADWLVGINATRALTVRSGGGHVMSLGRVQTPTLAMVCRRFIENRDFVPQSFWNIKVDSEKDSISFNALTKDRILEKQKADEALAKVLSCEGMTVTKAETKEKSLQPPYLHDLTSLQKEANRKYNLSAQTVLDTAQALYEKKFITYPRTGSKFIPNDVFATLPGLIQNLYDDPVFGRYAQSLAGKQLGRHSVDATKVTDHHALLPTEVRAHDLNDLEQKIYSLVVSRMLEAVSPKCDMLSTVVEFDADGVILTSKGTVVVNPGWKAVLNEKEAKKKGEEEDQTLPAFAVGDVLPVLKAECIEGKTKPKPLHTEASLLEAMEHAGRELDDEQLKDALKDVGIGTPATRAGEIETLLKRSYITRQKKSLVPTETGLAIYDCVKDKYIANVEMTGKWETSLSKIVDGAVSAAAFDESIRRYVVALTSELLAAAPVPPPGSLKCPKCGGVVKIWEKNAKCSSCDFIVWRNVAHKNLSDNMITDLVKEGKTKVLKGFKSKAGKDFSAALCLDSEFKTKFDFSDVPQAAGSAPRQGTSNSSGQYVPASIADDGNTPPPPTLDDFCSWER